MRLWTYRRPSRAEERLRTHGDLLALGHATLRLKSAVHRSHDEITVDALYLGISLCAYIGVGN